MLLAVWLYKVIHMSLNLVFFVMLPYSVQPVLTHPSTVKIYFLQEILFLASLFRTWKKITISSGGMFPKLRSINVL